MAPSSGTVGSAAAGGKAAGEGERARAAGEGERARAAGEGERARWRFDSCQPALESAGSRSCLSQSILTQCSTYTELTQSGATARIDASKLEGAGLLTLKC